MAKTDIPVDGARRTVLLYGLFLCMIVFMANWQLGGCFFRVAASLPGSDKTGHFVLAGIFALLMNRVLCGARVQIGLWSVLKGSLIVMIVVTVEELAQVFIPARSLSLSDLLCDYAGILCLGRLLLPKTRSSLNPRSPVV